MQECMGVASGWQGETEGQETQRCIIAPLSANNGADSQDTNTPPHLVSGPHF